MNTEIHSQPIESSEYPALVDALKDEPRIVSQLPTLPEESDMEPAPSIYHIINKQTFLSKELGQLQKEIEELEKNEPSIL